MRMHLFYPTVKGNAVGIFQINHLPYCWKTRNPPPIPFYRSENEAKNDMKSLVQCNTAGEWGGGGRAGIQTQAATSPKARPSVCRSPREGIQGCRCPKISASITSVGQLWCLPVSHRDKEKARRCSVPLSRVGKYSLLCSVRKRRFSCFFLLLSKPRTTVANLCGPASCSA